MMRVAHTTVLVWVALSSSARACPDCATQVVARARVAEDPQSLLYFVSVVSPFLVLGAIGARLHRVRRRPPGS